LQPCNYDEKDKKNDATNVDALPPLAPRPTPPPPVLWLTPPPPARRLTPPAAADCRLGSSRT